MTETAPLLDVEALRVSYGGLAAVDDVSFTVQEGQIVGLIGPNGAGKTSLIDALTGYTVTTGGHIRFDGTEITRAKPHHRARAGLARTFQSTELFDDLTVAENLAVASVRMTLWSTVHDIVRSRRARQDDDVAEALAWCGLDDVANRYPPELSHGQRRLVGVARALAMRPKLVLLDEPAAGLDTEESELLGHQLAVLPSRGVSVLLVDHDMSLVLNVCQHVLVLDFGRLIASGTPQQIRDDGAVVDAYLGAP